MPHIKHMVNCRFLIGFVLFMFLTANGFLEYIWFFINQKIKPTYYILTVYMMYLSNFSVVGCNPLQERHEIVTGDKTKHLSYQWLRFSNLVYIKCLILLKLFTSLTKQAYTNTLSIFQFSKIFLIFLIFIINTDRIKVELILFSTNQTSFVFNEVCKCCTDY